MGPASAGTKKGSGVVAPPISTPSVERPSLRPAYAPPVIAPDAPKPVTDGETKPGTPNESKPATPGKTKPRTPGRRQPDAGGRSDAKTLSESHVAAGERLALRGTLGGQLPQTSTVALAPVTGTAVFNSIFPLSVLAIRFKIRFLPYSNSEDC